MTYQKQALDLLAVSEDDGLRKLVTKRLKVLNILKISVTVIAVLLILLYLLTAKVYTKKYAAFRHDLKSGEYCSMTFSPQDELASDTVQRCYSYQNKDSISYILPIHLHYIQIDDKIAVVETHGELERLDEIPAGLDPKITSMSEKEYQKLIANADGSSVTLYGRASDTLQLDKDAAVKTNYGLENGADFDIDEYYLRSLLTPGVYDRFNDAVKDLSFFEAKSAEPQPHPPTKTFAKTLLLIFGAVLLAAVLTEALINRNSSAYRDKVIGILFR